MRRGDTSRGSGWRSAAALALPFALASGCLTFNGGEPLAGSGGTDDGGAVDGSPTGDAAPAGVVVAFPASGGGTASCSGVGFTRTHYVWREFDTKFFHCPRTGDPASCTPVLVRNETDAGAISSFDIYNGTEVIATTLDRLGAVLSFTPPADGMQVRPPPMTEPVSGFMNFTKIIVRAGYFFLVVAAQTPGIAVHASDHRSVWFESVTLLDVAAAGMTDAVWVTSSGPSRFLFAKPLGGGTRRTVTRVETAPSLLAVGEAPLAFLARQASLERVDLAEGSTIVKVHTGSIPLSALTAALGRVYWAEGAEFYDCPESGACVPRRLGTAPATIQSIAVEGKEALLCTSAGAALVRLP